ncbi:MAG: hypothetical protein QOD09_4925 [Bradyrhizobium sp.]|jgi:hypothetical protein|nr:hypothetical protein [Bradyrhizobium sp.]
MWEQYHAGQATGTGQASARTETARRAEPFPILLIEQPLTDAINFAQALYLMGFGLISHHEAGGDAIVALAHETGKRLEAVKEIWNEALREKRGPKRTPPRRRSFA